MVRMLAARHERLVHLDRHLARIEFQPREEFGHGEWSGERGGLAVDG